MTIAEKDQQFFLNANASKIFFETNTVSQIAPNVTYVMKSATSRRLLLALTEITVSDSEAETLVQDLDMLDLTQMDLSGSQEFIVKASVMNVVK